MPKKWTILSLSAHELLAHFAHIAENWSAEDLLLTPPEWQFRDRLDSHRELGCHRIALRGPYCKRDDAWSRSMPESPMLRTIAAESAIWVLLNIFGISWLSFAAY